MPNDNYCVSARRGIALDDHLKGFASLNLKITVQGGGNSVYLDLETETIGDHQLICLSPDQCEDLVRALKSALSDQANIYEKFTRRLGNG